MHAYKHVPYVHMYQIHIHLHTNSEYSGPPVMWPLCQANPLVMRLPRSGTRSHILIELYPWWDTTLLWLLQPGRRDGDIRGGLLYLPKYSVCSLRYNYLKLLYFKFSGRFFLLLLYTKNAVIDISNPLHAASIAFLNLIIILQSVMLAKA